VLPKNIFWSEGSRSNKRFPASLGSGFFGRFSLPKTHHGFNSSVAALARWLSSVAPLRVVRQRD
jgi:hypothetical protein